MMDDENVPDAVRDAVRALSDAPAVPREQMWARIEAARRDRRAPIRTPWATRIARWSLPLAATLAIGVALGRVSAPDRTETPAFAEADAASQPPTAADAAADAQASASRPYLVAAVQHLVSTEALLTSLGEDASRGAVDEAADWARDLLTNTRLLRDTPAATDPQLAALLDDLELILAQIAALPSAPPAQELRLIEDGIARNDVIGRLRAATHDRPFAGT